MYVDTENGKILEDIDFRKKFPNVSFTTDGPDAAFMKKNKIAKLDGDKVKEVKNGQRLKPTKNAELVDGKWKRVMDVEGEEQPVEETELPTEIRLQSPNGKRFKITVDEKGKLDTVAL